MCNNVGGFLLRCLLMRLLVVPGAINCATIHLVSYLPPVHIVCPPYWAAFHFTYRHSLSFLILKFTRRSWCIHTHVDIRRRLRDMRHTLATQDRDAKFGHDFRIHRQQNATTTKNAPNEERKPLAMQGAERPCGPLCRYKIKNLEIAQEGSRKNAGPMAASIWQPSAASLLNITERLQLNPYNILVYHQYMSLSACPVNQPTQNKGDKNRERCANQGNMKGAEIKKYRVKKRGEKKNAQILCPRL